MFSSGASATGVSWTYTTIRYDEVSGRAPEPGVVTGAPITLPSDGGTYTLYYLFVAPAARKTGAGRSLLLAAEATARAHGKVRMDLTTAHTTTTAQKLYESLGWTLDTVFRAYNKRVSA